MGSNTKKENECGFFVDDKIVYKHEIRADICDIEFPIINNNSCIYCNGLKIDNEIKNVFGLIICETCRHRNLKLITKTDAIKKYLLTEKEVMQFKFLIKPNTKKNRKGYMNLFLKDEIMNYSLQKYGSMENVEVEIEKRKDKRTRKKLTDLKKRIGLLKKKNAVLKSKEIHQHNFIQKDDNKGKCECGLEIEMFSFDL